MSQLVDRPKGLEAILRAKGADVQGGLVGLAGGADQFSGFLVTLGIGTLDALFGGGGVIGHGWWMRLKFF